MSFFSHIALSRQPGLLHAGQRRRPWTDAGLSVGSMDYLPVSKSRALALSSALLQQQPPDLHVSSHQKLFLRDLCTQNFLVNGKGISGDEPTESRLQMPFAEEVLLQV